MLIKMKKVECCILIQSLWLVEVDIFFSIYFDLKIIDDLIRMAKYRIWSVRVC